MSARTAPWFLGYDRHFLKFDVVAGLTAAAVVIPKALAYSVIAGLPVQVGLYTALVPMVAYALLGTSGKLSVSTTTTLAILTASELGRVGGGGTPGELITAAATLSVLVGAVLCLAAILRLGFMAYFISAPVLTGFKAGIALVIIADQLPKLLGFHIHKVGFFRDVWTIVQTVPATHFPTLLVAGGGLVLLVVMEKLKPHSPAPLVVVAAGIAASYFFGVSSMGVEVVGAIPAGLPHLSLPDLTLVSTLLPGAVGIALMSFIESIAAGKAFAAPEDPELPVDRELFALGAANLAGGFFQGMPAGGGTSQTAVNSQAGARTQAAGLVTALGTLVVMFLLAPAVALMPLGILAAVVIATTAPLINVADFKAIRAVRAEEFYWALIATAGVVLLGTLSGILVAVTISVLVLMHQANHPPVYILGRKKGTDIFRNLDLDPQDEQVPGMLILRTEGRLNFASVHHAGERMRAVTQGSDATVLVLDLSAVPDIEYTALKQLEKMERNLAAGGTSLWLVGLNARVLETVRHTPLADKLKDGRMFYTVSQAVDAYLKSGS